MTTTFRRLTPLAIAALLLATLSALAPAVSATETFACHSWEIFVGDRETGAGISTDDAAVYAGAGGAYLVSDGLPIVNPWIFSIWIATENNGLPGWQRGDEYCNEVPDGYEQDCAISCTF